VLIYHVFYVFVLFDIANCDCLLMDFIGQQWFQIMTFLPPYELPRIKKGGMWEISAEGAAVRMRLSDI